MRKLLWTLAAAGALALAGCAPKAQEDIRPAPATKSEPAVKTTKSALGNEMCPVMPGRKVKADLKFDYQGRTVYVCCKSCIEQFKQNPTKYAANLPPG